jgi:hypothetical protein
MLGVPEDDDGDSTVLAAAESSPHDKHDDAPTKSEAAAESQGDPVEGGGVRPADRDADDAGSKAAPVDRSEVPGPGTGLAASKDRKKNSSSTGDLLDHDGPGLHPDPRNDKLTPRRFVELEPISVPYLSPLVLRKEVENVVDAEGELCLAAPAFVDDHPILYWNLLWFFRRLDLHSHLPGLALSAKTTNRQAPPKLWGVKADARHVSVRLVLDNPRLHGNPDADPGAAAPATPMYLRWANQD